MSNTSPLTNLAAIDRFDLLYRLYGEIHIPAGVWDELDAGEGGWPGRDHVAQATWIQQHNVKNQALVTALRRDLDHGEAEGIALALELGADLLLLDEREGRRAADRFGLAVVGVLGVLLEAKSKRLLAAVRPELDALQHRAGFYLSDAVCQRVLTLANEG